MKTRTTQFRNKTIIEATLPSHLEDWFAEDIEVLWMPICHMPYDADVQHERAQFLQRYGDYRILRNFDDVAQLPVGIHGWIIPATANDSAVVCVRNADGRIVYLDMIHPHTGERMTYQSTRAYDIRSSEGRQKYEEDRLKYDR